VAFLTSTGSSVSRWPSKFKIRMGELIVKPGHVNRKPYTRHLLRDVEALDEMIRTHAFEKGRQRIGAEQELNMVDESAQPDSGAYKLLDKLPDAFTYEIGCFNLEANLDPFDLNGQAFQRTEQQLRQLLAVVQEVGEQHQMRPIITGILPTIRPGHLTEEHRVHLDRFDVLNDALLRSRGGHFELNISGTDDLTTALPSVMYEAANTSWQLHLQIDPNDFAEAYNWAQYIAAPVLAATANSPLFFGRELWHETRIALFQQSIDTRRSSYQIRDRHNRVNFGREWLTGSPALLFKDNITRFPLLLTGDIEEDSLSSLQQGKIPKLRALSLHNGTIYSWNRTCYGISDTGFPHLRIEARYIPCGPTVVDEIANFAFWVGLMKGMPTQYSNLPDRVPFKTAKSNFYQAARTSLYATLEWEGEHKTAREVILENLLPLAQEGLEKVGLSDAEISKHLGIIERRCLAKANGASWMIRNFRPLAANFGTGVAVREVTEAMLEGQQSDAPVHDWPSIDSSRVFTVRKGHTTVGSIMKTDLFTIRDAEPVSLAKAVMKWKNIRHLPVEDEHGSLVGLITKTNLQGLPADTTQDITKIMIRELVTVNPRTPLQEAARILKAHRIGCLPVVRKGQLIGMLTDTDFRELFGNY
jgi:CBS domain-containing protein